jgi:hypothetical protein
MVLQESVRQNFKLLRLTIPSTTGIHKPVNTVRPWTGNLTVNGVCTKKYYEIGAGLNIHHKSEYDIAQETGTVFQYEQQKQQLLTLQQYTTNYKVLHVSFNSFLTIQCLCVQVKGPYFTTAYL